MRITYVNTHDLVGGAERCSYDLARETHALGDEVELIVGRKLGDDPFVEQLHYGPVDWRMRAGAHHYLGLTETVIMAPVRDCWRRASLCEADVYNIHNMHGGYWNFWTVPILAKRAPVVLTLHDEWLLTGDCAYTYDCERWRKSCGACPQARNPDPVNRVCIGGRDATRINSFLKRSMLGRPRTENVSIVCPSQWLLERSQSSRSLSRFDHHLVPYGLALDTYRPMDRVAARQELELPADAFIVFAPAANLFDHRKNLNLGLEMLRSDRWPRGVLLVVAGNTTSELDAELRDDPRCRSLGYIEGAAGMVRAMNACDLTVVPSLTDNLPYTALEAQACGCPVLAARAGGIPETIADGETGWSFDLDSKPGEIAALIARIAAMPEAARNAVRAAARERAEARFDLRQAVANTRAIFERVSERFDSGLST
jgi:glycosyltransferase involved in cell wall biosynthesis